MSPAELSRSNPVQDSESAALAAIREVLEEEGFALDVVLLSGAYVETAWRPLEDGSGRLARVRVRLNDTSMGLALATRVDLAVLVEQPLVDERPVLYSDGRTWVLRPSARIEEKAEESRLSELVRQRWRRLARSAGNPP